MTIYQTLAPLVLPAIGCYLTYRIATNVLSKIKLIFKF